MSSHDLYRSVLRGGYCESSQFSSSGDLSPMSNLAYSLHGTSLSQTPRRRLSLSSNMTDTPQSCINDSNSMLIDSSPGDQSSDSGSSMIEEPAISPRRHTTTSSRNKENLPSPYYSPSRLPPRTRASPLQEVQNTVNRSLDFSPLKKNLQMVSPSKRQLTSPQKPSPPDDFDTTSQDSGYSESGKKVEEDCFSVPVSCAPRKLNLDLSPPKPRVVVSPLKPAAFTSSTTVTSRVGTTTTTTTTSSTSTTTFVATRSDEGRRPFKKFSSLIKGEEDDAILRDLMNEVAPEDYKPLGFSSLLAAPLESPDAASSPKASVRPSIRRCLSMVDTTPTSSRVFSVPRPSAVQSGNTTSFKRPNPPSDTACVENKRRKLDVSRSEPLSPLTSNAQTTTPHTTTNTTQSPLTQRQISAPEPTSSSQQNSRPKWQRCHSESHVSIMKALNKSSGHDGDLIGDFSKPLLLPILEGGKHPDLKAISVDTLADVVQGKYNSRVASCRIIDCRYPYEYKGGHIMGAEMWDMPDMASETLKAQKAAPVIAGEDDLRHIMVFHCEFSAERGPKTQRMLREIDRTANKEHYPALHFPEVYLLEGGYKSFYESYPELCTPNNYVKMLDPDHTEDFKHFRSKSKSWAAENKLSKTRATIPRPGLKRLGL